MARSKDGASDEHRSFACAEPRLPARPHPDGPVTLFRSGDEFRVLPSDELDDEDDLEIVHEFHPWPAH